MTSPRWSPVDSDTTDILTLVADLEHPSVDHEWEEFTRCLRHAADTTGHIDPNALRPLVRGVVAPKRIGAFTHRAKCAGLIADDGWVVSDDATGRNAGRPARAYRWLGGAA